MKELKNSAGWQPLSKCLFHCGLHYKLKSHLYCCKIIDFPVDYFPVMIKSNLRIRCVERNTSWSVFVFIQAWCVPLFCSLVVCLALIGFTCVHLTNPYLCPSFVTMGHGMSSFCCFMCPILFFHHCFEFSFVVLFCLLIGLCICLCLVGFV